TRGDAAQQRQALRAGPAPDQFDRPGVFEVALDQPLLLQGLQVAHHPIGRRDVELESDLAHRRAVAAIFDFVPNELVNLSLAIGQLTEVWHRTPPAKKKSRVGRVVPFTSPLRTRK